MSDKDAIDVELANERLQSAKEKLYDIGLSLSGFRPDVAIAEAERKTVMDILIGAGLTTEYTYTNHMAGNIMDSLDELVAAGMVQPLPFGDEEEL